MPIHSIPGSTTMLVGATGSGKTHAIRTLIDAGITPFVLFTEPGMRTLSDIPSDKLHWKYIPPANPEWATMIDSARKINTMSYKALSGLGDINKTKYGQFLEVLTTMNNFVCDRTGEEFGDVATWGTDRCIIVDSLSGLNIMAMDMVVGAKPVKAMGDWGVAMDNLARFIQKMTTGLQCHHVLISHLEREHDEVSGATHLMPSTLGKKLAPKLPQFFDDVVLCEFSNEEFHWATQGINIDLKWRNLEGSKKLPPSFVPLIKSWVSAGGVIESKENQT